MTVKHSMYIKSTTYLIYHLFLILAYNLSIIVTYNSFETYYLCKVVKSSVFLLRTSTSLYTNLWHRICLYFLLKTNPS